MRGKYNDISISDTEPKYISGLWNESDSFLFFKKQLFLEIYDKQCLLILIWYKDL